MNARFLLLPCLACLCPAQARAAPEVSNVTAAQRAGTKLVDIQYDLEADAPVKITLEISSDGGATYAVRALALTGDFGLAVPPGAEKLIIWDAAADWDIKFSGQMRFRVVADDFADGLSYIPAGPFVMGRTSGDTSSNAPPTTVNVSAYKMMPTEVSKAEWDLVRNWGALHGYSDLPAGAGKEDSHPVQTISWYAAVKWCNARSEMENLTPCYYTDSARTLIYRTGNIDVANTWVRWEANGYRLPTEAEWEKAARGGVVGKRFPWGSDIISHALANFNNSGSSSYAEGTTGTHPTFTVDPEPYTSPCGFFAANAYGLHDMAGNVYEWIWDWYDSGQYSSIGGNTDPVGPASSPTTQKVRRGGSAGGDETVSRSFYRFYNSPTFSSFNTGFRVMAGAAHGHPAAAQGVSDEISVETRPPQTLTFNPIPDQLTTDTVLLSATGGLSGMPVTFAVAEGPGIISNGNELSFTTSGIVKITASQDGNASYAPAPDVTRSFEVTKAVAEVHLGALLQLPDGTPRAVSAQTVPEGLDVVITYNGSLDAPVPAGLYEVEAVIDDLIYQGSATAQLLLDHRLDRSPLLPGAPPAPPTASDIAWEGPATGLYDGLLIDSDDEHTLLGAIENLRVSAPRRGRVEGGAASGRLRLPGLFVPLRGRFALDGTLSLTINRRDGTTVVVTLKLQRTTEGNEVVTGTIAWGALNATARLPRAPFNARNKVTETDWIGAFTLLLPSAPGWGANEPGGDGWARVTVSSAGVVRVKGRHGDGTVLLETAYLSAAGECALFAELYRSRPVKGRFGGSLHFRDMEEVSDCDGLMQWVKLADDREKQYPAGFDLEVPAVGSRFTMPPNGGRLLAELEDAEPNASLSLIGSNLPALNGGEIERVLSWLAGNVLRHYGPETLGGRAVRGNGQVSGSYRAADGSVRASFTGIVLQKQNLAGGQYALGGQTGALRIVPGTDFPYPGSEDAGDAATVAAPDTAADPPMLSERALEVAAAGVYGGVLSNAGAPRGGIENLRVSNSGAFSGSIWIAGVRHAFTGAFDFDGSANGFIERPGLPALPFTLQIELADGTLDGYQLTGTVTITGAAHQIDAQRLPAYTRSNRAPQEGSYTLVMTAPENVDITAEPGGDACAILKVNHLARCTGTLLLPDSAKTTFSGHVSRSGEWSLHRALYGNPVRGFVAGKVTFREIDGVSDLDGLWRWVRQSGALPSSPAYQGGFAVTRPVSGARFQPPAKNQRAWSGLDNAWHNIWARLAGPNLATIAPALTGLDRAATWSSANKIVYHGPDQLQAKFNPRTGWVSGTYNDKPRGVRQPFGGVLLQAQRLVSGHYHNASGSGRFWMEKR